MLQKVVEYLKINPAVVEQVKAGTASLIGLNKAEEKAVMNVFAGNGTMAIKQQTYVYWM